MEDGLDFFSPGTHVVALPNWKRPRLFVPARSVGARWRGSAFYPAYRLRGQLYRGMIRLRAAASLIPRRPAPPTAGLLEDFVRAVLPEAASISVLVGTPGPAQKLIVQCRDAAERTVGYLKYAVREPARRRLEHEHQALLRLPAAVGPAPLRFGPWRGGTALLVTPLEGTPPAATLPPAEGLAAFTRRLLQPGPGFGPHDHPWVRSVGLPEALLPCLDALAGRRWPVAFQHGDLAPWNLARRPDGELTALDWEYAVYEGFPYLDYLYYYLQVASHIYEQAPETATSGAARALLAAYPEDDLTAEEACALVRLAAYDAYRTAGIDQSDSKSQPWRRTIWENVPCID